MRYIRGFDQYNILWISFFYTKERNELKNRMQTEMYIKIPDIPENCSGIFCKMQKMSRRLPEKSAAC